MGSSDMVLSVGLFLEWGCRISAVRLARRLQDRMREKGGLHCLWCFDSHERMSAGGKQGAEAFPRFGLTFSGKVVMEKDCSIRTIPGAGGRSFLPGGSDPISGPQIGQNRVCAL
jgi:hypothetical protein